MCKDIPKNERLSFNKNRHQVKHWQILEKTLEYTMWLGTEEKGNAGVIHKVDGSNKTKVENKDDTSKQDVGKTCKKESINTNWS